MARKDFTIRILVKGGKHSGLRLVEKSNWNGYGLIFSRSNYADIKERNEFSRSGVYLIVDSWSSGDLPEVYVGEGDEVRSRLDSHFRNKDFWNEGFVFTDKNDELNKAQIKYLESRLCEKALKVKRCNLVNGNTPRAPSLSEMDLAEVEGFLDEILVLLPTLGVFAFQEPEAKTRSRKTYSCRGKGYAASGWETSSGFVVQKGSVARKRITETFPEQYAKLRKQLLTSGVLTESGDGLSFEQDYEFTSPSYAASMARGMRSNGRTTWKDSKGKTLKQHQEKHVQV